MLGQLVWVRWLDSEDIQGWISETDLADLLDGRPVLQCESVGWVVEDSPSAFALAGSKCPAPIQRYPISKKR